MPSVQEVLLYWGKARASEVTGAPFHPVAFHLLDVAAVVSALLEMRPTSLARAAALLRIGEDDAHRVLVALAVIHDIGKFTPYFQAKAPHCWPEVLGPFSAKWGTRASHTDDGYLLWRDHLSHSLAPRIWVGGTPVLDVLAPAVFGHHGRPIERYGTLRETRADWQFRTGTRLTAVRCAELMIELVLPEPIAATPPSVEQAMLASWWIAGILTTADWVGSREIWFKYQAPGRDEAALTLYWEYAKERAREAVLQEGLATPRRAALRSFSSLTKIEQASPTQRWAETALLPEGPLLIVIEDVTGAGKTEAAQMIVHRFLADGRASGAYWAMPTQATANAMYKRQADAIDKLFTRDSRHLPSLILAHGQSRLNDGFTDTVLAPPAPRDLKSEYGDAETTSSVACAAFFTDDRRAAMLADIGAGTIDQAVLSVLPSKFNTMRLFGLAEKVLVIDEAHAYDAYVNAELQELLRFHAALGGSAIVLSATLTQKQRASIVRAWREGLAGGVREASSLSSAPVLEAVPLSPYPMATVVSSGEHGVRETPLKASDRSRRSVRVRLVPTVENALEHLLTAREQGAAVAWVRNTVRDCLAAATMLRERGIEPIVFHARFAQGDRQRREAEVMALFGKDSTRESRRGRVLIATQVIEQSLDLDFDVMVSDLAPIDLLIQRAGRLWRHDRVDERTLSRACELVVLAPPPVGEPESDWLTALLPGTARVYKNHSILWHTARILAETGSIDTPDGLRRLIESVYAGLEVADALMDATSRAEGEDKGKALVGLYATLKVAEGYQGDSHGWVDDLRAVTRLSDRLTTVVRLARVDSDGSVGPWERSIDVSWKAWALSEVRVDASRVPLDAKVAREYRRPLEVLRAEWPEYERETPVIPLVEGEDGEWRATLTLEGDRKARHVRYSAEEGLRFE